MTVRVVHLAGATARYVPGAPYAAFLGPLAATGRFRRDYVEVLAVTSGEGRSSLTRAGGTTGVQTLRTGQMYLFRPIDLQEISPAGTDEFRVAIVAFPFVSWQRFVTLAALDRAAFMLPDPPMVRFDPADPDVLQPFHRAFERFWNGPTAMDLIEFLVATIGRFLPTTAAGNGVPPWLWTALVAMNDEPNLRGGVPRFTELAHVSPAHLWRSTRRYLGMTPTDVVRSIQLQYAAQLLSSTESTLAAISERCGFTSASYFSKAFRRRFHMSPRDYRAPVR